VEPESEPEWVRLIIDLLISLSRPFNKERKMPLSDILRAMPDATSDCPGQLFRADRSEFFSPQQGARPDTLGVTIRLRRLKRLSCPGCDQCAYLFDILPEVDMNDFPVDGIETVEHGRLYEVYGRFSPVGNIMPGADEELDGLAIREIPEET
jgi:hypothetical protein